MSSQAPDKLKATFGGYSTKGVKPENQDAFGAMQPGSQKVREMKGVAACIADGVSCSENAQKASQTTVSQFVEDYYASPDTWTVKTAVSKVLSSLNAWLFHHGSQGQTRENGFVTTFATVIVKSNTAHLFHVGDSRIYRYRPGSEKLVLLTRDHSHRQKGQVYLTRALGMDNHLEIDYRQEDVEEGDVFVLTTDGVHNFVSPAEVRQAIESGGELEADAQRIVLHALNSDSDDNASLLLMRVDELPSASIDEVHRKLTELAIPPVMDVGMKIDGYEIKRVIHNGTRSHLYLVQHPDHSRPYVLKAPSENFADDPQYLDGFVKEQWIGLRIDHDSVMKIYPTPQDSKFLYLLMEYIDGKTLRQWLHDNGTTGLEKMREITQGIVTGLRVFQRLEMVHRDLKPENVMITDDGRVKIIDFGTVKVRGLGELSMQVEEDRPVGSVDYIAPEYLMHNTGNYQSDLFSLGVMVYEMLSGKLPYNMSHVHRRMPKSLQEWKYTPLQQQGQAQAEEIPVWVDAAIRKATHPSVKERYDAFSEFMQDLLRPNNSLVQKVERAPLIERNPVVVWQGVSAVLLLVVVVQAVLLTIS